MHDHSPHYHHSYLQNTGLGVGGAVYEKELFYLELFHIQPMLGLTELRCSLYISLSRPVVLEDLG